MSPQGYLVLSKALARIAKEMRPEVNPGEYEVDETVTLRALGKLLVGEDYDQRIANKAKPWKLLKAALNKLNGVTIESLVREAEEITPEEEKELRGAATAAAERLKEATWTRCNGKVTTKAPLATELTLRWDKGVSHG